LLSIEEVNVVKIDINTGYKWEISFTKNIGNLPNIQAYNHRFGVQLISSKGGYPTPIGGTFILSYGGEVTKPLAFDITDDALKFALQELVSIDRVDVKMIPHGNGQFDWLVTFRIPESPLLLDVSPSSRMKGSLDTFTSTVVIASQQSLISDGERPKIAVEEKVPGLPSYTGTYKANETGAYSLAVLQLQNGGLSAWYYDNQWLTGEPTIERVDGLLNFNWGMGSITMFGRDYVSIRWWGKVQPKTSEEYTFYVNADDGVRLFVDHNLLIDDWTASQGEKKATTKLFFNQFHDIRIEYREETGPAHFILQWSSKSLSKETIPQELLFNAMHIEGSPFENEMVPGAADYPHSDLLPIPGTSYNVTVAGEPTHFYIQAKDANGNIKKNHDNWEHPEEQFTVEITGSNVLTSGDLTYMEGGRYRVDYTLMRAGMYQVHVRTGGTDIYCGNGENEKCSPFALQVTPGPAFASTSEAESLEGSLDFLTEARVGEMGTIRIQAKDVFGNNLHVGGEDFIAQFRNTHESSAHYRGYLTDSDDGKYELTYSIPIAGVYHVVLALNNQPVRHCTGSQAPFIFDREYNGLTVYNSPEFCNSLHASVTVVHNALHASSSTIDDSVNNGLVYATVGQMTSFVLESRDKFGNIRAGAGTNGFESSGDGSSDAFLVTLESPGGYIVKTSSAVQIVENADSSVAGYFRVRFRNEVSEDLPHDISAAALQTILMSMCDSSLEVHVDQTVKNGSNVWKITFLSHLLEWMSNPLRILDDSTGNDAILNLLTIGKTAHGGLYPAEYTVWRTGIFTLTVTAPDSSIITDTSYTVEVSNGPLQASSSVSLGPGLVSARAGDQTSFYIQAKDSRRSELQSIRTLHEGLNGTFTLAFNEKSSEGIPVDATEDELKQALEKLDGIGSVLVHKDNYGLCIDNEVTASNLIKSCGYNIWTVTFAVEGSGCEPSNWNSCPSNIGDIDLLVVDDSLLSVQANSDEQSPLVMVSEIHSGSAGNNRTLDDDSGEITLSLSHGEFAEVIVGIDTIQHVTNGLYQIYFTPIKSGHYDISLQMNDEFLWTDLSSGMSVVPSSPDAKQSHHDASLSVKVGNIEEFNIVAFDRFGNRLLSDMEDGYDFLVHLIGTPDTCSGKVDSDEITAFIQPAPERDGRYMISYSPRITGMYSLSMLLRSKGGLLTKYFFNPDFTHPYVGHNGNDYGCPRVSFDWGLGSPLPMDPTFPLDYFSIRWEGDLVVPATNLYTFTLKLDGGARLTIGSEIVIDSIPSSFSSEVSGYVYLEEGVYHPIQLDYVHSTDEANVALHWESSKFAEELVPDTSFFYSREINGLGSFPSPVAVTSTPGEVHVASDASGKGLISCIALEECSFVIQTKDLEGNSRFSLGQDPQFEIEMVGVGGWAADGRINNDLSSKAAIKIYPTVTSLGWQLLGTCDATYLSKILDLNSGILFPLNKGSIIAIDGVLYTLAEDGTPSSTELQLDTEFLGKSIINVNMFQADNSCKTGTHLISYTPNVRGVYKLDVRLPPTFEIQKISTYSPSSKSISGSFVLTFDSGGENEVTTNEVSFDATASELQDTLREISFLHRVKVRRKSCADPTKYCSWKIIFIGLEGQVSLLEPYWDGLLSGSDVAITKVQNGQKASSINGFPTTVEIIPGKMDPVRTVAYGSGIMRATAGEAASFFIQPKDSFGNNLYCSSYADKYAVYAVPERWGNDNANSLAIGVFSELDDCSLKVSFVPILSGYHTIAVVARTFTEVQTVSTNFASFTRGGVFYVTYNNLRSLPVSWNASGVELMNALEQIDGIANVTVTREALDGMNHLYSITFDSEIGNVEAIEIDTSSLIGNDSPWQLSSQDGNFQHIMTSSDDDSIHTGHVHPSIKNEVQRISINVADEGSATNKNIVVLFRGYRTSNLTHHATSKEMKNALESLSGVGFLQVTKTTNGSQFVWDITFTPNAGGNIKSLLNYGQLPLLHVMADDSVFDVDVSSIQSGQSPFRVFVEPAEPSAYHTYVTDLTGVSLSDFGMQGFYKEASIFKLQLRDCFSNIVESRPQSEIQIIETSSQSSLSGEFTVSFDKETVKIPFNAGPMEMQKSLRNISGLGAPIVTSNSANTLVSGKTVTITKGKDSALPSDQLTELKVGDWIRIGDQSNGPIFTIVAMDQFAPFAIALSSIYVGPTMSATPIFQHGSPDLRSGYQYIIQFDPVFGDLPALSVNGSNLLGDNAKVVITACDQNRRLELTISSDENEVLDGYFVMHLGQEHTNLVSVHASPKEIENEITSSLRSVDSIIVKQLHNSSTEKHWVLSLVSANIPADIYVDGKFLTCDEKCLPKAVIKSVCGHASSENEIEKVQSVDGSPGLEFAAILNGPERVQGTVAYNENGAYSVSYQTPKVGVYNLNVESVLKGGLMGEYFSNRWLFGEPVSVRLDESIDFYWSEEDPITPTGKDFVSVR
jgi:hypothetical protein